MRMGGHREDVLAVIAEMLDGEDDVSRRKMFGYPAFFAGKKMVACVWGDGVALRASPETAERLIGRTLPVFEPDPGRRKMNGWVLLVRDDAGDLRADAPLLQAALESARDAA